MSRKSGRSLLWQIGFVLMLLQTAVATLLTIVVITQIRAFHDDQTLQELRHLTPLVAARLVESAPAINEPSEALASQAREIADPTGLRITIIRPDGRVLADSAQDARTMDNHRYRPEIDAALEGGSGHHKRESGTISEHMLFFAQRFAASDGSIVVVRTALPLTRIDAAVRSVIQIITLAVLASLGVTIGVIYLVSHRLSATVSRMAHGAQRFARGELKHRIIRPHSLELAALAEALNNMADQLSEQMAELQTQQAEQRAIIQSMSNGMLALDLEHHVLSVNLAAEGLLGISAEECRGHLLQEVLREPALNRFVGRSMNRPDGLSDEFTLRHGGVTVEAISQPLLDSDQERVGLLVLLNDVTQLRRLETIRSDFASNVSHELRTPITNIKGYVETMLDVGCGDESQTRRFLQIIRRNTGRLEAIIEDLLALAQLEQSRKTDLPNRLPVPVRRLVESSVAQVAHAAKDKNMPIRLEIEDRLGVLGAPQLLEQAVSNLLSNAVTYGPRDSVITIRGRALNEDRIEISVIDKGPGIAPDHLPRLFERFYRVDKARSREQGGTGLGLAIVKHIARAHGGHVEVESRLGEGSTFRLVLTRARP